MFLPFVYSPSLVLALLCIPLCPLKFCKHLDEEDGNGCFIKLSYRCLSFGLWLFLTLLWVDLHCKIVVFHDHTACTDPGNIVGGAGGGGGGLGPSATSFFSHQLNLRFFLKKNIFFQDSREGPTFSGGRGGVKQTLPRGGGSKYKKFQITGGGFGPPFPLWILA